MRKSKLQKWIVKDKGAFLNLIGLTLCIFIMIGAYLWFISTLKLNLELERRKEDEELREYIS